MKAARSFILLFVGCILVWISSAAILGRFDLPFGATRNVVYIAVIVGIPTAFACRMAIVGYRHAQNSKSTIRALVAGAWVAGFAIVSAAAFVLAVVPAYFHFGGRLF
jgi:uncharacterized membrane protein